ncbi:MAG: 5'/3'-nucleotidase SurE [Acidimicrobiia bacterium]|nr:5'/3'-nucleotidase SurE [Acidimicrobiia bacterium]
MSYILVTNDDGVDSLSLPPLARSLQARATVHVAAPAVERSWIGKAISRFEEVPVKEVERDGIAMMSVAGYPADAVQLGMYNLFEGAVEMVVSGVNIGANFGSAYYAGSGTVGAALEAGIAGVPAFAFSVVNVGHFKEWASHMRTPESIPDWERYAETSAAIVDEVMEAGFPEGDTILTVNMPAEVTVSTRRRVTHIADTTYGQLFKEQSPGIYRHDWLSDMEVTDRMWGSDIQVVANGEIAVTPVRIASASVESAQLRDLWD